jgi:signal transduction histidine kinase
MKFLRRLGALRKSRSPWFFLGGVGLSVFIAEIMVMLVLGSLPKLPEFVEAAVDAGLLSILVTPALYYFLYQPLRSENANRVLMTQELQRSAQQFQEYNEQLESKVADRTQALSDSNLQRQTLLENLHRAQVQMVQSEKMSALGQMVAGVAHEINNPVSFIHGNLSHVREYIQDLLNLVQMYQTHYPAPVAAIEAEIEAIDLDFLRTDLLKVINSMRLGTDRIRAIVLSLRNFSRLDEAGVKPVDLHQGIDSTILLLQHRLNGNPDRSAINVTGDYGDLPDVECFPGQINQVLMNILANAIDALTIQPEDRSPSPQIQIRTAVINAMWVEITIGDNGIGMEAETRRQMFNPFFTTKPVGQGTGMGLAISYQIITENHRGHLNGVSTPGVGTEFTIQIPVRHGL